MSSSFRLIFSLFLILCGFGFASAQTVSSIPLTSLPQNTRLMIWGDSVTEAGAWYPRYEEGYLTACLGRPDLKIFTAGHSGATLSETISRETDLGAFNPTIVQFFYGFNDDSFGETPAQWNTEMQAVISMYQSKGIAPIVAGPGWTDNNPSNPSYQQTLTAFNSYSHADAVSANVNYSDICNRTELSLNAAVAAYGTSYTIGVHYGPPGAITVAYEDLKTLACDGNIGTINVDIGAGTASASSGHTVVSYSNGTVILDSSKYPFCYNYSPNDYSGTEGLASMLPYVPFTQDLNRFMLVVANLGAPSANVTWGSQTKSFTSAQLAAGINLTEQFTTTPFDTTFAQVMAAILNKQYFENYESKLTGNYFGNDNGGNIDGNMAAYQAGLDAQVKALVAPVRHSIVIVPSGASTAVAPVITGTMMAYPTVNQSFSYQISVLNGANNFTQTGLPNGLTLNSSTGQITGTPTAIGISVVTLTAKNANGTSLPTTLTLNVEAAIPAPPGITSPLTATATVGVPFSYQITATNNPTNYFVVVPGNVGTVGTLTPPYTYPSLPPGLTYNTTTGVFSGTPTTAGTYNVNLAAVNAGGVGEISETNPFVLTINPGGGAPPPTPTGLAATAGSGQVSLSWSASAGASSYNVYRGTSAGGESATAYATGITTASYADTSVTNGTTYYYEVKAVNTGGTSGYSNEANATPISGLPAAPTGLVATGGNMQVSLNWTASVGATSYNVYRGTLPDQENTTPVATGITTTSYVNTGLINNPTFYFKVAAVNSAGTSTLSNEASAATGSGGGTGSVTFYQDSFTRSGDVTGSAPDMVDTGGATWANSAGSGQYPISGGTASINPAAYSWSAEYLPVNGSSGITLDGTKDFSLSVVVTSGPTGRIGISLNTGAPGGLFDQDFAALSTCSAFAGAYAFNGGTINYSYSAGISGPTTISLAYSASAGTVTYKVGTDVIYTQTGVTPAEVGAIRYVAMGDDGYGGSTTSPAATPAPTFDNFTFTVGSGTGAPAAPSNLSATAGNAQVFLSWTASSGATTYNVYRGATAGGESTTPIATGITMPSYTDTSVTNGTAYYYEVVAVSTGGASGYSNETNATPVAPTYALTVTNGIGSGSYAAGTQVTVTANTPSSGYQFSTWTGATSALANPSQSPTTLTMPSGATAITATFSPILSYTGWADRHFTAPQQADPTVSGPTATPQNDGVVNLLKYLCDIDPTVPMTEASWDALPLGGMLPLNNPTYLTLTYREDPAATDLTVVAQSSTDAQNWGVASGATSQTIGTDSTTGDPIIQVQVPITAGAPTEFIRLKVTSP